MTHITIDKQVVEQALEALELLRYWNKTDPADTAITTLRAAIEAAEKVEPVAWTLERADFSEMGTDRE